MFGSFNIFSIFSRIRFHDHYHIGNRDSHSGLNNTANAVVTPNAAKTADTKEIQPVEQKPTDKIEISPANPDQPQTEKVTYTPESVKANAEEAGLTTPPTTTEQPPAEETPAAEPEAQNKLVSSKSLAKLNLKMAFSLSDFQSVVTAFAEDAKDGQIDTTTYSNLNIGLHADLDAKAIIKEKYQSVDGQDLTGQVVNGKEKLKYDNLEASMIKSRGFEAASFYRESLRTNFRIHQNYRDGFLNVARKLSMRYTQDFGMNLRAISQFNSQAESLDQAGQLQSYLGSTEALVDSRQTSGELINKFFDTVDSYLNGAEDKLIKKINGFFDNLASEMGIDSELLNAAKETMVSSISSFFDQVDQAINSVQSRYIAPQPEPAVVTPSPEPVTTPAEEPELVGMSEAEAAA
ncbi:MAG: hypothetical protein GX409_09000 [candidate division Zixibacteria bacterium]|nr:hypothetical protein [candidate division Zixibacteria bacterium]